MSRKAGEAHTAEVLSRHLLSQSGDSAEWPSDERFAEAWRTKHAYSTLNNPKIVFILKRLNETFFGKKMEAISIESSLTIEHIMPQSWVEHWLLPGGIKGLSGMELFKALPDDQVAVATRSRNSALQTLGNLTILTQALNSSVSNGAWEKKRSEMLSHSLLPINQQLQSAEVWDENSIEKRSADLLERSLKLWPKGVDNPG